MSKLDTVTHRVDISPRTDLQPDENFTAEKITDINDILVASLELIAQLDKPTSLDDLAECYPFTEQIGLSTERV